MCVLSHYSYTYLLQLYTYSSPLNPNTGIALLNPHVQVLPTRAPDCVVLHVRCQWRSLYLFDTNSVGWSFRSKAFTGHLGDNGVFRRRWSVDHPCRGRLDQRFGGWGRFMDTRFPSLFCFGRWCSGHQRIVWIHVGG